MKADNRNIFAVKAFLREYLDLRKDKDNELATVDSIRKGVEFKGANLWILIFAIFMASLGLNVNSTAVIIGAMLISPLMGPIMGVGLSVGLNRSRSCWHARHRQFMTFSSHFSVDLPEWLPFLPKRKEM